MPHLSSLSWKKQVKVPTEYNSRKVFFLRLIVYALPTSIYLYFSVLANKELSKHGYALFMDERITFDGVRNILHPSSFNGFVFSLFDGGDQRYGRDLWNFSALASWIPERIFSEQGQIFATRMLMVAFISIGGILFCSAACKSYLAKAMVYLSVLLMPYTSYYSNMPKPEPIILFLIGAIFYLLRNPNPSHANLVILLLGILIGTKISTIPFAIPLFLYIIIQNKNSYANFVGFLYLLSGLGFAVPTLGVVFILPIIFIWSIRKKIRNHHYGLNGLAALSLLVLILLSNLVFKLYFRRDFLKNWVNWTFLGTGHSDDSNLINFATWTKFFFKSWFVNPTIGVTLLFLIVCMILEFTNRTKLRLEKFRIGDFSFLLGILLNLSVFLGVHRLWGMYLYIGTILIIGGIVSNLEDFNGQKYFKVIKPAILVFVTIFWFIPMVPDNVNKYKALSAHSTEPSTILAIQDYNSFMPIVQTMASTKNRVQVTIDPKLYVPLDTKNTTYQRFWGELSSWPGSDLIIISKEHVFQYSASIPEQNLYFTRVSKPFGKCIGAGCFSVVKVLPSGGQVLQRNE